MELKDIKAIIDLMRKNDLSVFEMEKDGFRLKLQKGISEQPISMMPGGKRACSAKRTGKSPPQHRRLPRTAATDIAFARYRFADGGDILSGGFARRAAFVDVGKEVIEETVVCIIEAMKVMNEIKAETSGRDRGDRGGERQTGAIWPGTVSRAVMQRIYCRAGASPAQSAAWLSKPASRALALQPCLRKF